jgi:predicted nucleic acid-binding protein
LALAEASAAVLVTGDDDLLALTDVPVFSPAAFLEDLP